MNDNLAVFINNKKYNINNNILNNMNIIDFCVLKGYIIPRFCYHSQLSIAGNCRMCLVEVSDSLKPIVSCAMLLRPSIQIFTNTFLVKKARENVLEFLLINHPLDCPICDQGGECDLQDQTLLFGNDRGRFYELKKVSFDKNCNLFIKTIMTRCIHCTRCIRFLNDLSHNFELGMLGRGYNMEIGNYIENNIDSELASNIIDLCPVGALTSKTYSFKARPWELINFKSFDILDIVCSTITMSLQGTKIIRILPYNNENINNVWLTDKSRYFFDSFYFQRISNPYQFSKFYNKFVIINWFSFYKFIFFLKKNVNIFKNISFFLNLNFLNLNDLIFFKSFKNIKLMDLQLNNLYSLNKKNFYDFRSYLINKNMLLKNLKNNKIIIFLNNYNLRLKNPLLNLELIKNYKFNNGLFIFSLNNNILQNSNFKNLDLMNNFYLKMLKGYTKFNLFISKNLRFNDFNLFIFNNLSSIQLNSYKIFKTFKFNNIYIPSNLFEINKLEINLNLNSNKNLVLENKNYLNIILEDNLYLNNFFYKKILKNYLFNIFFNSHHFLNLNLKKSNNFDFILPLNLFIENNISTFNIYGIFQKSYRINNWFKNSKSLNYFLKFIAFNFNLNYNKLYILNYIKILKNKIKFNNLINLNILTDNKFKIINWFNQTIFKNLYIINNLTNNSLLLNKNLKKDYKNFKT